MTQPIEIAKALVEALRHYQELHDNGTDRITNEGMYAKQALTHAPELLEWCEDKHDYEQSFHRIMGLLKDYMGQHGTCLPRHRKACSACNAADIIEHLLGEYKGARVIRSDLTTGGAKWESIDSAPKDGRRFLAVVQNGLNIWVHVLRYSAQEDENGMPDSFRSPDGAWYGKGCVTHWMPLPPAPHPPKAGE